MSTISINEIESTKAFQSLNAIQKSFAVKRKNREILTNALIVHKNSGIIPGNVVGYNLNIVEEMIIGESAKFERQFESEPLVSEQKSITGNRLTYADYIEPKNNESAN